MCIEEFRKYRTLALPPAWKEHYLLLTLYTAGGLIAQAQVQVQVDAQYTGAGAGGYTLHR